MTRWVRALAAGILLAAMMIGLPVLLIVLAGWPFPSAIPDWDNVGRMLRQGDIPADAVIKTLAVVLWVLWVGLVWSFVWELRTCLTSVSRGERPPRPSAPAVPAAMSAWMGRLVAATLALGAVSTPSSSSVASPSLPVATVVVDAAALAIPVATSSHAVTSPRSVPAVARQWVTGPADTVWDIAERALGDGLRVDEIVRLNPGLRPARPLPAGRSITLPADAAVPADRRPVTSAAPTDPATLAAVAETSTAPAVPDASSTDLPAPNYLPAGEVTVEAGDNLWDLSEQRLAAVGVHDDDAATATLLAEVIGINPDVVEDPNLIFVGERFCFPAVGTPPATEQATSTDGPMPIPVGADGSPAPIHDSPTASAPVVEPVTDHVVTANESYWSIATDQRRAELGREPHNREVLERTEALIATNAPRLGHDDPAMLHVGDVVQPVRPATVASGSPTDGSAAAYPAVTTYIVVEGDSLSELVEAHYGRSDGELVWAVSAFNGLEDPGSISAGQLLVLPVLAELVEASPAPGPVPTGEESSASTQQPPVSAVVTDHVDPAASTVPTPPEPAATVPVTLPAAPTTVPPGLAPSASSTRDTPRVAPSGVDDDDEASGFEQAQRTVWWSVPMGLLLASGIVVMARRLRNRRLHALEPGEQLQSPPPVAAGTELAATVAAGAPTRLATLQALLRSVTPHARELDDPPPVRAVELSDDRVEILFAEPAPFPPTGWSSPDGGRSWVHRIADGAAPGDAHVTQLVTPALVTLGRRRGGGEVLLDVETAGSTAVVGDRAACLGLARSMALELGTYPLGVPMDLCLVGVDVDGLERCDRAWANTTMTRAVRVARDMLERTTATGEPSLMAARAATDEDEGMLDPQVFIVDRDALGAADAALLDELLELCQPQAGAAVVVIGEHRAAREVIRVDDGGAAEWAGASLEAPVLTREAVAQVAVTFEHAATAAVEPLTPSPVVADLLDGGDSPKPATRDEADDGGAQPDEEELPADPDGDDATVPYVAPTPDVLVRLMGEVDVVGRDVTVASDVELLALLVCLRERSPNIDTITTVLRRDKIKPIQNRVSTLRAKLGVGSDGEELLPLARSGRGAQGRYRVSRLVMTDVELLEHRYQCSLSLPSQDALVVLRHGLALMAGPAFRARKGFDWAVPEGVQSRVASIVNAYAARLMELAFEADQLDLVVEAARCAGRVIDDPVAEVPMRRLEREYAEASGNPELWAAVAEATRRLGLYAEETDRLVPDDEF